MSREGKRKGRTFPATHCCNVSLEGLKEEEEEEEEKDNDEKEEEEKKRLWLGKVSNM